MKIKPRCCQGRKKSSKCVCKNWDSNFFKFITNSLKNLEIFWNLHPYVQDDTLLTRKKIFLKSFSLTLSLQSNSIKTFLSNSAAAKSSFNFHHTKLTKKVPFEVTWRKKKKFPFKREGKEWIDEEKFGMKLSRKEFHILCDLSSDWNSLVWTSCMCTRKSFNITLFRAEEKK